MYDGKLVDYIIISKNVRRAWGAGVRWTPLRSRSTDRGGSRDIAHAVCSIKNIGRTKALPYNILIVSI